ncbi:WD40 repeat-like protein [Vararia minispora EC-137]|uniref:WD40 repeat-like protein n=1 Tax=Vararia minispora EC-137 TaxID=1314806 RepID=A0ACB8QGS2_9AGAM|nr:WD40 repeat-like protein [Vararia minispora EC-137]
MATKNGQEDDDIAPPERPSSPPPHTTFAVRGLHPPNFAAFRPRDMRITSSQGMEHVAWSCDGRKLAAVGIDKIARVWQPDKALDMRSASIFSGGHSEDIDYVSWNPTHPELFCTNSQRERRITFWDARQSRNTQQLATKLYPWQTNYSPDGRSLLYVSSNHQVVFLTLQKPRDDAKEEWMPLENSTSVPASTAMFNHVGDGIVLTHNTEHTIRIIDYPNVSALREAPAAHVGGCIAAALDPRGRYLASGGHDSIVNMFDTTDWICTRTITSCEHQITALSFSYDGEFLAIASSGSYIDICAPETGMPMHRVQALTSARTVSWHPSRHVIAYCGQTRHREGGPPPVALVSLFGPGVQ